MMGSGGVWGVHSIHSKRAGSSGRTTGFRHVAEGPKIRLSRSTETDCTKRPGPYEVAASMLFDGTGPPCDQIQLIEAWRITQTTAGEALTQNRKAQKNCMAPTSIAGC